MTRLFSAAPPILRPYQLDTVAQAEESLAAGRNPVLVLPTGSGKTVIAGEVIKRALQRGLRVLFVAPRRELIHQTREKLHAVGIEHGVIMAGIDRQCVDTSLPVQVASIDTLAARSKRLTCDVFDVIVIDEAHLAVTKRIVELASDWGKQRLGLTATPTRKDGRALGVIFDTLIEPVSVMELIRQGHLVPARYFSWPTPDLRGVRTTAGDYNLGDLEQVMNQSPLLGDVVTTWMQHAADRRTIVFCTSIAHAIAMAEAFRRADIAAEHVDAGTPTSEREATFARFRAGTTQVLTNCFLAAYGFDLPAISAVVLARPTKSLMLYLQMVGRALRPDEGKTDCLILDHAGNVHRHGRAEDERHWTLDGHHALVPPEPRAKEQSKPKECPACHAVWSGSPICPECGYELRPQGKLVRSLEGELVELVGGERGDLATEDRKVFYGELKGIARERGYKPGWAFFKFREKFNTDPPFTWKQTVPAMAPTTATLRWVKSRTIAWSRAQRGAA